MWKIKTFSNGGYIKVNCNPTVITYYFSILRKKEIIKKKRQIKNKKTNSKFCFLSLT